MLRACDFVNFVDKDDATSSDSDVSPSESNGEQPSNDNPDSDSDAATPDNTGQTDPGK